MSTRTDRLSWVPYPNDPGYVRPANFPNEYQVTEWEHPDASIETCQWGTIKYRLWLELESRRWLEQNLRPSWIRENPEGLIALWASRSHYANVGAEE